jgi:hypothetical protein
MPDLLIGRTDPGFLSNPALCPNGHITMAGIKVFAPILGKHAPMYIPFLEAVAALGWIDPETVVLTGGNGYLDAPEIIRTDAGLGLRISNMLTIPMTLYPNSGGVTTYITRKVMPEEPTAADYFMLPVEGVSGEGKHSNTVIGIGSNFVMPSGNPLVPALVASIRWKLDTYFSATADNSAHLQNVQKTLAEVGQGHIPAALARPMVIGVKTKDVAPGLYHVRSISRYVGGKATDYLGQIQMIAAWNDLGTIPDTDVTLAAFLSQWDGKLTNNVSVKACLGAAKAIEASFDLYEMTTQISGTSDRFLLVSPMLRQTDPDKKTGQTYPYVVTKGFALSLSETLPTAFGSAAILVGGIVQEANANNCPIAPGHLRDPFSPAQPAGTPIMPPSMLPAAVAAPAAGLPGQLPVPMPMPTQPMPLATPAVAAPLPTMPQALPTMAAPVPTMPPAIEVPAAEAFDLPFAADLPGATTTPMSAVAPPMPAPVPAPPAPVAEVAPVVPVVSLPVVPSAPVAPVMPLPVDVPAAPVAASSTVSKAKTRATVAL